MIYPYTGLMLQRNIPPISTLSACHYICKTTKAILGEL